MNTRVVCGAVLAASVTLAAQSAYVPERVYGTTKKQFADFEVMLADVVRADVVFVGEEHNDPNTHRVELALLEGIARRRSEIVLALEMFERDVAEPLAHFLMGHMEESEFLGQARPWTNYGSAYKPLVDFAISKNWPVVAAAVPRSIAAEVATSGLGVLKGRPDSEKGWFAKDVRCPSGDRYASRVREATDSHTPNAPVSSADQRERYYLSQCLKDETMAESIAEAYLAGSAGGKRPLVVSINGAFHSDFGEGTAERVRRRVPDKRVVLIKIVPVDTLDTIAPDADMRRRADYLVYTIKP